MSDRLSSEQCRSELYAWFREHASGELAEYLMSRLAPAPLSDLVTKDYLDAALARSAVETATGFAAQSAETAALRSEMATKSELEAARKESRDRHRRTMAFGVFLGVEILAVQAGWLKPVMDLLASVL